MLNPYIKKPCKRGSGCCSDCGNSRTGFAGAAVIDSEGVIDINYSPRAKSLQGVGATAAPAPSASWFSYLLLAAIGYYTAKHYRIIK